MPSAGWAQGPIGRPVAAGFRAGARGRGPWQEACGLDLPLPEPDGYAVPGRDGIAGRGDVTLRRQIEFDSISPARKPNHIGGFRG